MCLHVLGKPLYSCTTVFITPHQRPETGVWTLQRDCAGDYQVQVCCKQARSVSQPSLNMVMASKTDRHTFTTGLRRTTDQHANGQKRRKAVSSHRPHPHVTFEGPSCSLSLPTLFCRCWGVRQLQSTSTHHQTPDKLMTQSSLRLHLNTNMYSLLQRSL